MPSLATAADPVQLFTRRTDSYARFIRLVGYQEALRSYFWRSPLLRSGLRVLDAGCGTGALTLALREALLGRGLTPGSMQGFDLTPAMLDRFRQRLDAQGIKGVEMTQCDVLQLDACPVGWKDYDLVVSASPCSNTFPATASSPPSVVFAACCARTADLCCSLRSGTG